MQAAGHPNVESLLAELWKTPLPAARQLCAVARATAPRHTLQGEALPAEFPDLAQALLGNGAGSERRRRPGRRRQRHGRGPGRRTPAPPRLLLPVILRPRVSVEQAGVIIRELVKTGPGCSLDDRAMGERVLIEHAPGLTVEQLRKLAVQVRERLDQDGTEPREQAQRRLRSLTISTTRDGMIHINWYLDAESAGHVLPQLTAYVSQDYRASPRNPGPATPRHLPISRRGAVPKTGHRATPPSLDTGARRRPGHAGVAHPGTAPVGWGGRRLPPPGRLQHPGDPAAGDDDRPDRPGRPAHAGPAPPRSTRSPPRSAPAPPAGSPPTRT